MERKENGKEFLNAWLMYYRKILNKEENINMFHDIKYKEKKETNRCMEMLYEEVIKYREKQEKKEIEIIEEEDYEEEEYDEMDEIYILTIGIKEKKICESIIPLIKYISEREWEKEKWSINKIK